MARRPYIAKENNARVVCGGGLVREASVGGRVCAAKGRVPLHVCVKVIALFFFLCTTEEEHIVSC